MRIMLDVAILATAIPAFIFYITGGDYLLACWPFSVFCLTFVILCRDLDEEEEANEYK